MAAKKRAKRRGKSAPSRRQTYVLLKKSEKKQIREFSKYIPKLADYKGKDKITSAQYGAFKQAKTKLRHVENLKPVTEAQAKKLKGKLVGGGIRAIRLRDTGKDANVRVKSVLKGGVVVTTNGRDWEYHPVHSDAGGLPEALIEKGRELFNRSVHPPWQIHLWTSKGRANEGKSSFQKWAEYVMSRFGKYHDPSDYLQGVAILVRDGKNGFRKEIKRKSKPFEVSTEDDESEE